MVTDTIQIRKGSRKKNKLRMSIDGVSKSGKTFTAMRVAFLLSKKVVVIDTQNGQAELYHGYSPDGIAWEFDVIDMPNCEPLTLVQALQYAARQGYEVIIIDSFSHEWYAALEMVDDVTAASKSKNAFTTGWKTVTPQHNEVIEAIQRSPCHIIATMRAKTDYVIERDDRGISTPRKIGLGTIQREGVEYEFDLTCRIDIDHNMTVTGRCPAVDGKSFLKPGREFIDPVIEWLNNGSEIPAEYFAVNENDLRTRQANIQKAARQQAAVTKPPLTPPPPASPPKPPAAPPVPPIPGTGEQPCTQEQRAEIQQLFFKVFGDEAQDRIKKALEKRKIGSLQSLTDTQAKEMIDTLIAKLPLTSTTLESVTGTATPPEEPYSLKTDEPCTQEQIEEVKKYLLILKQDNPNAIDEYKASLAAAGFKETAELSYNQAKQLINSLAVQEMKQFFSTLGANAKKSF